MPDSPEKKTPPKWHHPSEVMKLHKLKMKKKALQARINRDASKVQENTSGGKSAALEDIFSAKKRKNPFAVDSESKRVKQEVPDESTDRTLFKLLHQSEPGPSTGAPTSFENILNRLEKGEVVVVKGSGETRIPIDWTPKRKVRLWSNRPFCWNHKLKISEEASGTTGFVRCLEAGPDASPNARFHQCCLYWQQPSLPWLQLFPRHSGKVSASGASIATDSAIRAGLQEAWADGLRSLFQLLRTKQCPYFYACANSFTALFRAAGVCGFGDSHALLAPTTKGLRQLLRQEEIEFSMPLKKKRGSDQGYDTLDSAVDEEAPEEADEKWLQSMGLGAEDIKQINYTQARITHRAECEVDNSEQSLVLVEGVEVHALYNFLINCKSATSTTGPLAGIPPTLLAPVAFHGATLNALKVRESKVHVENDDFYSLELAGPVLPSTVLNLFGINPPDHSMSATFVNATSITAFSKVTREHSQASEESKHNVIFDKENLSDCGLSGSILEQFCTTECITSIECLKYNSDSKTYTWT